MKISRLLACIAAALVITITACSRDPKPGTPEAAAVGDRYMHSMSDTLAHAQTFTFDTDEQLQVLTPSEEKHDLQLGRKVTVRPDGSRFCLLRPTYLGSPWWPYRI